MKRYSIFPNAPALLEPHHQRLFRTLVGVRILPLCRGAVGVFYSPQPTGQNNRDGEFWYLYTTYWYQSLLDPVSQCNQNVFSSIKFFKFQNLKYADKFISRHLVCSLTKSVLIWKKKGCSLSQYFFNEMFLVKHKIAHVPNFPYSSAQLFLVSWTENSEVYLDQYKIHRKIYVNCLGAYVEEKECFIYLFFSW